MLCQKISNLLRIKSVSDLRKGSDHHPLLNTGFIEREFGKMSLRRCATRSWLTRRAAAPVVTSCRSSSSANTAGDGVNAKEHYDIIVAGGGMVGCTLACALAKNSILSGLKVLLLEGSPKQAFTLKPEYSNRVSALNQNTKTLMSSIGAWQRVENLRFQPVHSMQVWDASSEAMITFDRNDANGDVAYIVENDVLLHAVNSELDAEGTNVSVVYGARVKGYELPDRASHTTHSTVIMNNSDTYSCRLLIGADGANSQVRKTMGVQYLAWSYEQMGVVATLHLAECQENSTAWQRFLPTGPVALLPLGAGVSSLVWSTAPPHAKQLLALPDEQFVDALNDAIWKQHERNGAVESSVQAVSGALRWAGLPAGTARLLPPSVARVAAASRAAFPLGFGHSTRYVAPRVALVGDAAHRVHPLAGQGVNLGFGDVRDLVRLLADSVYRGEDLGTAAWLEQYERERQRHNVPTQLAIEALHRLYSLDAPPAQLLRGVGLQLTHALAPLKKAIISHATA